MIKSMTGFATAKGALGDTSWVWDLRSVNSKGLDLRLRVPDWIEGLEPKLRAKLSGALARGAVSLSLRVSREDTAQALTLNQTALTAALAAMAEIETQAMDAGLSLAPATSADIIALRGLYETQSLDQDVAGILAALLAEIDPLIADFDAMRGQEGTALAEVLNRQLNDIAALTDAAETAANDRRAEAKTALNAALARVVDAGTGVDPDRVAAELAMLAVKADVTEELDRLRAHIAAAREMIATPGPIGRKLDFLMQEFNREANTLCSKSQSTPLTRIGLDLKTLIDQMREQVQNVE